MFPAPLLFFESIGRQLLTTNSLFPPTTYAHTHTHTHFSFLSFSLSWSFSPSVFLSSTFPPPHPPHSSSVYASPLALPRFFPISPLLKSETAQNPTWFFFGQPRGNGSEREAQVRLQLLIKNLHCPAWRDVRNDVGFDLSKPRYATCTDLYEDILYSDTHLLPGKN